MLTVPLYIFLFIYLFFLLAWGMFFFINLGHLVHTGTLTMASFVATFAFIVFSALVLFITINLILGVDWQTPVTLWNSAWFGTIFQNQFVN